MHKLKIDVGTLWAMVDPDGKLVKKIGEKQMEALLHRINDKVVPEVLSEGITAIRRAPQADGKFGAIMVLKTMKEG